MPRMQLHDSSSGGCALGSVALIVNEADRRGLSKRELERRSGIDRRRLGKILSTGDITLRERERLFDVLDVSRVRAFIAVDTFERPELYGSAMVSALAHLTLTLAQDLDIQIASTTGVFTPLKNSLLEPLARELAGKVMEIHCRKEEAYRAFVG